VRWSVHSSEKVTCTLGRFGFFAPADARGTLCGAQPGTGAAGATAAGLGMIEPAQLPLKSFPAYAAVSIVPNATATNEARRTVSDAPDDRQPDR